MVITYDNNNGENMWMHGHVNVLGTLFVDQSKILESTYLQDNEKYGVEIGSDITFYTTQHGNQAAWHVPFVQMGLYDPTTASYKLKPIFWFGATDVNTPHMFMSAPLFPKDDNLYSLGKDTAKWSGVYSHKFVVNDQSDVLLSNGTTITQANLLGNYCTKTEVEALQKQIDGEISSWFFVGPPIVTSTNVVKTGIEPFSEWLKNYTVSGYTYTLISGKTNELINHIGDTYTDISSYTQLDESMWEKGRVGYTPSDYSGETYENCKYDDSENKRFRLKEPLKNQVGSYFYLPTPWSVVVLYYDSDKKYNGNYKEYSMAQEVVLENKGTYVSFQMTYVTSTNNISTALGLNITAGQSWRWCDITSTSEHSTSTTYITVEYNDNDTIVTKKLHWHKIADSDAVKALRDAAAAQLTADTAINSKLSLSGGQMTGPISFPTAEAGDQVMLKDGDNDINLLTYTLYGMQAGRSLYPGSSRVDLGRSSNYWNNGYVNTLYSHQIKADDSFSITAGMNLFLISECESLIIKANDVISDTNIYAPAFFETSDIRKKDIKSDIPLDKCYELIDKCQTIIYSLKEQTKEQIGMIAQEIEEFFPEVVETDKAGFKSLAYDRLVVICFKVLKDVIKRLEKLENAE